MQATYTIDGKAHQVDLAGSPPFSLGAPQVLSTSDSDATFGQAWYPRGFQAYDFLDGGAYERLKQGVSARVRDLVQAAGGAVSGFDLERYHRHATSEHVHLQTVGRTRDLFPPDFNFDVASIVRNLGDLLGFRLTDVDPVSGEPLHIIIRINRPGSGDFNPPHKDVYEAWDQKAMLPRFVNFWIPIAGVSSRSSLPVAPGSHLLPEDRILRTRDGGVVAGRTYRVRTVLQWGGSSDLERARVEPGKVLVFTPHLVHGCAINDQPDTTRVSLEFRLFRA